MRQQLLNAIYAGQPFRQVLRDLGLTLNQVWGLTKADEEWSEQLGAALMASRRDDLKHRTTAAYVADLPNATEVLWAYLFRWGVQTGCWEDD